jgi:hypothetical protein
MPAGDRVTPRDWGLEVLENLRRTLQDRWKSDDGEPASEREKLQARVAIVHPTPC